MQHSLICKLGTPHCMARVIQIAPDIDVSENHFLPPYSGVVTTMSSPYWLSVVASDNHSFSIFWQKGIQGSSDYLTQTHCQTSMLVIFPISCLRIPELKLNEYQGFLLQNQENLVLQFYNEA